MSENENKSSTERNDGNPPVRSSAMSREERPSGAGPELMHGGDAGLPLPIPAIGSSLQENTKGAPDESNDDGKTNMRHPAGLEEIHDNGVATEPFDESAAVSKKSRGGSNNNGDASSLAITDNENDGPASPFSIGGEDSMKQQKKVASNADEETAIVPSSNDQGMDIVIGINTQASSNQRAGERDEESPQANDDDGGIHNVGTVDTDASAGDVPTTPTPEDSAVAHIPDAFLVESTRNIPIFDAVQVPDESWWTRHKIMVGSVAALSVAVIIAAVVGTAIASEDGKNYETLPSIESVPTLAPTLSPAPMNCTVQNLGPVYESDCDWCTRGVARDGDTIVMVDSDSWSTDPAEMHLIVGPFSLKSHVPDHHIEEMAFSSDSFFASDPYPFEGEAVVSVSPKDASGGILNETILLAPAHGDVDSNAGFGTAIAVDGDVLVVGAPNDNDSAGSAFIYRRTAGTTNWSEEAKLVPEDSSVQSFGNSVLVKDDNLVIVAADHHGSDSKGAVFFYEFDSSSNSWQLLVDHTLINDDCDGNFGASLALTSDDGLLIGCPLEHDAKGAVYYYQRSDDGQYNFVQKITANDGETLEKFGGNNHHLAMNSNGDFVAVGTFDDASGLNEKVYIFGKFDNIWREVTKIDAPESSTYFGSDVVISGDRVLITSWENTYSYILSCFNEE